ncbi:MAG: hypothetical protein COB38_02505 [Gammaproteobacteria bacterium]|nr:MAG: hypothetical protein COB38_02505 [Gammaproteobacteria bacterium]
MTDVKKKIGIILIAGGNSSRLGHMKQMVKIEGKTFLQNSFEIAQQLSPFTITVLGYNQEKLISQVDENKSIFNQDWPIGMGTSIALGVKHFIGGTEDKNTPVLDGVMIIQCDQYRLTFDDYSNLIEVWRNSDKGIVASQYLETSSETCSKTDADINPNKVTVGAPAIFSKFYYDKLLQLKEKGAKALLKQYSKDVEIVKLDDAAFDLDTNEDLNTFNLYLEEL